MNKIEISIYTIDELSEQAKQKAIDQHKDFLADNWEAENSLDYHKEELEKFGYNNVKILFSGFSSQGDGACFTADIDIKKWIEAHDLNDLRKLYNYSDNFSFSITHQSRYYYATSTTVVWGFYSEIDYSNNDKEQAESEAEQLLEVIKAERERLGNDIYQTLRDDYFAEIADDYVLEDIRLNEYQYLSDGTLATNLLKI